MTHLPSTNPMAPPPYGIDNLGRDESTHECSSLLQRRLTALKDPPNVGLILTKRCQNGIVHDDEPPSASTLTPTSVEASDESCSPKKPLTGLQRRRERFRSRPSIDCSLVQATAHETSPFFQTDPQGISKRFEVYEALGQGTTGVVFRASRRSDGQQVALKMMRMNDEEMLAIARQEFELLRNIKHPHIIQAMDFFTYPLGAVMVLSYFAGKTLEASIAEAPKKHLPEETSRQLFRCLVLAVEHLHQLNIIHRDVKAANVLVAEDHSDLKLVDFNTAQQIEGGALTMTGTVDYLPPEVLLGDSLTKKSDVWAMGLCLHLMLSGNVPVERRLFWSRSDFAEALAATEVLLVAEQWHHVSSNAREVLRSCLAIQADCRATAADVLASDWLGM